MKNEYYVSLLLSLAMSCSVSGCGKENSNQANSAAKEKAAPDQVQGKAIELSEDAFTISKEDNGAVAFVYKDKKTPFGESQNLTAIRIHSAQLAGLQFNKQDFYLDRYDAEGNFLPFFQIEVANKNLSKNGEVVMLNFDGSRMAGLASRLRGHAGTGDAERFELRILLSDDSKPGDPIVAGILLPL